MGHLAWCCLVLGRTLGMGRLHAMCWSSMTLSAKLSKVVSRNLPSSNSQSSIVMLLVAT